VTCVCDAASGPNARSPLLSLELLTNDVFLHWSELPKQLMLVALRHVEGIQCFWPGSAASSSHQFLFSRLPV